MPLTPVNISFSCALILLLAGCSTTQPESHEQLTSEINTVVNERMTADEATAALTNIGFTCKEGTAADKGIVECTRSRGRILFSCVQRVQFEANDPKGVIAPLDIYKPACAGL